LLPQSVLEKQTTMRTVSFGSILVVILAWGCSDGTTSPSRPISTPPLPPPESINILFSNGQGNLGAQSFSPNPSPQSQGGVAWHNTDTTTHRIVSDDGSFDTGEIAPGSTIAVARLRGTGGPYHCTIHPNMVGTIMGYWDY